MSFLDELFNNPGFDHVSNQILSYLNAKDFKICRLISQNWKEFIDNNKQWWRIQIEFMRNTKMIFNDCNECDEDNEHYEDHEELIETRFPEWKITFEHFIKNENTENLKNFTEFMWKYLKSTMSELNPLHFAVREDLVDIVNMLSQTPTDFNIKTEYGYTPIFYIRTAEMFELFFKLKKTKNINFNARACDGYTFYHDPVGSDLFEVLVKYAQNLNIDLNEVGGVDGSNIFHEAIRSGTVDYVLYLLNRTDIKIDALENNGWNALHVAANCNRHDVFEAILKRFEEVEEIKIDLDTPNTGNETPFHIACGYGSIDIVKLLIKLKSEKVFRTDIVPEILTLSQLGYDFPSNDNGTPFHHACQTGEREVVEFLYNFKPKLSEEDQGDYNALVLSARNEDPKVFNFLYKTGEFDLKETNVDGQNAVHFAVRDNDVDIFERLLQIDECKDLFKQADNDGNTPLQDMARFGCHEILELLFDKIK